jgi:hypothetical protein
MVHWRLHVLAPRAAGAAGASGAPAVAEPLAEFAGFGGPDAVTFSPDGRRLAYVLGGRLYAHDIAPQAPAARPSSR